jgi:hypothetical protein
MTSGIIANPSQCEHHFPFFGISSDEFVSLEGTTELLLESSLLQSGVDLRNVVANHVESLNQERPSSPTPIRLTYGVQNINPTAAQYPQGFPFVRERHLARLDIFTVTLCPPHNVEFALSDTVEFDLGFTVFKSERYNCAVVDSVARSSPAAIVGVRPTDRIKFAFSHTLSSPFRTSVSKFGSVTLLTNESDDIFPPYAVYHAPEVESAQAAEYALSCLHEGNTTTFEEFTSFFPFDITKPLSMQSPTIYKVGDDPILYPVTVVFERGVSGEFMDMNDVFEDVTKSADRVLSSMLSCFGGCIDH